MKLSVIPANMTVDLTTNKKICPYSNLQIYRPQADALSVCTALFLGHSQNCF